MSQTRRRPPARQNTRPTVAKPSDIWRPAPPLADPPPVVPSDDPTALLRSLGDPPLHEMSVLAGHYLAAVVARAAGLATALALSADPGEPATP